MARQLNCIRYIMSALPRILLLFALPAIGLFSCISKKALTERDTTIKRLKSDSLHLTKKVDSLSKIVQDRSQQLSTAQKTIGQLAAEKEKKIAARKKIENEHYDKVSLYVYNIAKYVDWHPSTEEQSFVIGIVGNDEIFAEMREQFEGKKIADKPVLVTKMNNIKELSSANLYFVSTSRLNLLSEIYKKMKKNHALVVSDIQNNTDGVHINFFADGDTLRFEMNDDQIKKSKLTLSSSLKHLQHK